MKKVLFFSILLFFAWGCHTESPKEKYPGFSKLEEGLYIKRITIGDGKEKAGKGDLLVMMTVFTDNNDSALAFRHSLSTSNLDTFTMGSGGDDKGLEALTGTMCEGDSSIFMISPAWAAKNLQNLHLKAGSNDMIRLQLHVLDIQTAAETALQKQSYAFWCQEMAEDESKLLKEYLSKNNITATPDAQGLYFIPVQAGSGRLARKGDKVLLKYSAKLLDGTEFDNTEKWKTPFEFTVGMQGELLPALEIAVGRMRQGEKVRLIAPSRLAFGEKGSSNGVVSPFKTITFDLQLVTIK